jgi:hypothetical protein
MREMFQIILLILSISGYSQKVTITGTAFDTTNGRNWVQIVVNDTLRKFGKNKSPNWNNFEKLIKDTTVNMFAKADGKFQVKAYTTDSIFFQSFRHIQKVYCVSDLLKMKKIDIRLDPEICIPYVRCDSFPSKTYVFVGQKIKVEYEPEPYYCDVITWDLRYHAEYRILEQVHGHFDRDTIRFTVFDHYGIPAFSKYETVLLFVSDYCGQLYHQKYQYFELYKTADGKWANPGNPYKYDSYLKKNLVAQNIKFADTVYFDISKLSEEVIKQQYPEPYYKIERQKAIPVMGSYIDDLITVKKDGILKERMIHLD